MKQLCILLISMVAALALNAQCPGCIPVDCSAQNPDGGLCDSVMIGMANNPVDEQISFYMPKKIFRPEVNGFVDLQKIKITGVTGLPFGLTWESNRSPNNEYFPQNGDTVGCVRVCGTPIQAGTYPLTVYLLADVVAPVVGVVRDQPQTYDNAVVIVLPDTSGGVASFTIVPNITKSCDPLNLSLEANFTSTTNPVSYDWDFGNGNTGNSKNPPDQSFNVPGDYPVTLTTTFTSYVIRNLRLIQVNNNWAGDIEEWTTIGFAPDLYFKIPSLGYTSPVKGNTNAPTTWNNLSIHVPIGVTSFEIEIWDQDNGPPLGSPDDFLGAATINVAAGSFLWSDVNGTITNGDITLQDTIGNVITETLNITIANRPEVELLSVTDSICGGDSTTMWIEGEEIVLVNWFKDSVLVPQASDTFYTTSGAGFYWARVVNTSGCDTLTNVREVKVFAIPRMPTFFFNPATQTLFTNNSSGVALIRWYQNGVLIDGENGNSIPITDTGSYQIEFVNVLGCSTMSGELQVSSLTSVANLFSTEQVKIYPNPSSGVVMVELNVPVSLDYSLEVIDFTGRVVYREAVRNTSSHHKFELDLNHLTPGGYLVKINSGQSNLIKKINILR